jgi:hypothetical protein
MNCKACGKELSGKQTVKCSNACKVILWQRSNGWKRKRKAIDQKGGSCSKCGYNKNLAGLVFHHLDPQTKLFKLDLRTFTNTSSKRLQLELEKCVVLCHNCHAELHYPQFENR